MNRRREVVQFGYAGWDLAGDIAATSGGQAGGIGRDAAEVAFCTQFGQMEFDKPEVSIEGPSDASPATTQAVRVQDA